MIETLLYAPDIIRHSHGRRAFSDRERCALSVTRVLSTPERVTIEAVPRPTSADRPVCCSPSRRIHSWYRRLLHDLPWPGRPVAIHVTARRFRCPDRHCYGYRRVGAALRHQSIVVNGKKLRRLMREHDLQPERRRRYVVTTDSDHAGPIFPDLAKDVAPDRPNQL